jgi:hypothetical protein
MPQARFMEHAATSQLASLVARRGPTPIQPPFVRDAALCTRIMQAVVTHTTQDGRPPSFQRILATLGLKSRRTLHEGLDDLVRTGHLRRLTGCRYQTVDGD